MKVNSLFFISICLFLSYIKGSPGMKGSDGRDGRPGIMVCIPNCKKHYDLESKPMFCSIFLPCPYNDNYNFFIKYKIQRAFKVHKLKPISTVSSSKYYLPTPSIFAFLSDHIVQKSLLNRFFQGSPGQPGKVGAQGPRVCSVWFFDIFCPCLLRVSNVCQSNVVSNFLTV